MTENPDWQNLLQRITRDLEGLDETSRLWLQQRIESIEIL